MASIGDYSVEELAVARDIVLTFGMSVESARKRAHLTTRALAEQLDIPFSYLNEVENGYRILAGEGRIRLQRWLFEQPEETDDHQD